MPTTVAATDTKCVSSTDLSGDGYLFCKVIEDDGTSERWRCSVDDGELVIGSCVPLTLI